MSDRRGRVQASALRNVLLTNGAKIVPLGARPPHRAGAAGKQSRRLENLDRARYPHELRQPTEAQRSYQQRPRYAQLVVVFGLFDGREDCVNPRSVCCQCYRFRSSHHVATLSFANLGIKGALALRPPELSRSSAKQMTEMARQMTLVEKAHGERNFR
jgi:hypothetical protein